MPKAVPRGSTLGNRVSLRDQLHWLMVKWTALRAKQTKESMINLPDKRIKLVTRLLGSSLTTDRQGSDEIL